MSNSINGTIIKPEIISATISNGGSLSGIIQRASGSQPTPPTPISGGYHFVYIPVSVMEEIGDIESANVYVVVDESPIEQPEGV